MFTPASRKSPSEYPRAAPHIGSKQTFRFAFRIVFKSTISARRFRYWLFTSRDSFEALELPRAEVVEDSTSLSLALISNSIFFVTSGSAGQPSQVENLMPLYCGGLCEAVKLITPSA